MLPEINLLDADFYERRGTPHDALTWLRANAPLYWHANGGEEGWPGFWAVTKHEDVAYISRHPGIFSSYHRLALFPEAPQEMVEQHRLMMLNMDPPRHSRQRSLVNRDFTPRMISRVEGQVREIVDNFLNDITPRGEADFVRDISAPLPVHVLCKLFGVPPGDYGRVLELSSQLVGYEGADFTPLSPAALDDVMQGAAVQYYLYADNLAQRRCAAPADDIVTRLLAPDRAGECLTNDEFDMFMLMLAVAGTETTRNAAAGGMLAFFEYPEQWHRLLADPGLLPSACEEVVRWVSPINLFRRTAMRDTTLRGQRISEGDKVVMFYASANRDEAVFPNASTFDVGRQPNPHFGFGGGGPHYCLGKHLAALELRILFEALARRAPDIAPAGPATRFRSYFVNGINRLPVQFTPSPPVPL